MFARNQTLASAQINVGHFQQQLLYRLAQGFGGFQSQGQQNGQPLTRDFREHRQHLHRIALLVAAVRSAGFVFDQPKRFLQKFGVFIEKRPNLIGIAALHRIAAHPAQKLIGNLHISGFFIAAIFDDGIRHHTQVYALWEGFVQVLADEPPIVATAVSKAA